MPQEEEPSLKLFGFVVRQAEDGRWLIAVTGDNAWYLSGFETSDDAHQWVLEYLTTLNDNNQRLQAEIVEKVIERNSRLRLLQAEMLASTTIKGKGN